jgi:octopine/nopaline transport system ATP-binding protein
MLRGHMDGSTVDPAPALVIRDLHKRFGQIEVLKGVSLSARQGDVIAIIGGSGSGKSTLLRSINLLEQPSAGTITIHGEPLAMRADRLGNLVPTDRRQVQRIRSALSMVFQSFNLWQHLTVLQNIIEAPIQVLRVPRKWRYPGPRRSCEELDSTRSVTSIRPFSLVVSSSAQP